LLRLVLPGGSQGEQTDRHLSDLSAFHKSNPSISFVAFGFDFFIFYIMEKVEHIGIAVKSLDISIPLFEKLLNARCYKTEQVETEKVKTAFFQVGETKIELLESFDQNGVIGRFVEKRGEGIHHIAFEVSDIKAEIERLKAQGFTVVNETPHQGADNKWVCFLHPKTSNGVLVELCQSRSTPTPGSDES
jgi:methylmalonyl-CoA/ethylmalonyl-CoA epimerase